MDQQFVKRIELDSDLFDQFRKDFNFIIQRLIGNMLEKDAMDGKISVSIDVGFVNEYIPNMDKNIEGETRLIRKPNFKHKISSTVKITDDKGGNYDSEMELVMGDDGCYVLKPVANTQQMSIFDDEFDTNAREVTEEDKGPAKIEGRSPALLALLGNPDDTKSDDDVEIIDGDFREITTDEEDATDDMDIQEDNGDSSDGFFTGMNEPIDDSEDYEYDEPEE